MTDFDAIVIGSGFGGAVAACRLVGAGKRVCLLERGRRYDSQPPEEVSPGARPWSDFPDLPRPDDAVPDPKRWAWGDEQGLWDLRNLDEIVAVQAAGYGGGSLIYANVHLRAPREVFEGWPFGRDDLDPYYVLAAYMLGVGPITRAKFETPEKTLQFQQAAAALGRDRAFFYPPLAVNFDGSNAFGCSQRACNACGECITGCPYRAKNTLDFNYLAIVDASELADVRTQAEAVAISAGEEGGYEVTYLDHLEGGCTRRVSADWVFVCAGAVHTTELLLRSSRGGGLPHLNRELLGSCYFPNADFPAIVYDARTPGREQRLLGPTRGPTITACLYHGDPLDEPVEAQRPWCLVQEGGFPAELARHMGVFRAPALLRRNRHDDRETSGIAPVEGRAAPLHPVPLPDGDPPLLRSFMDGLYAILENESEILARIAPGKLVAAVDSLETELTDVGNRHLRDVVGKVRARLLRRGVLKLIPARWVDRLAPDVDAVLEVAKDVLHDRYGVGNTGRERVQLATRLGSWLLEFDDDRGAHSQSSMILLGMGPDDVGGTIKLAEEGLRVRMHAGWDADLSETESVMRDVACALGGKLRVNPLWSFGRKAVTVHSQGGAPMSDDPEKGVTSSRGEVHGHPGLFVMDAAAFPTSIGVNPSATIAAVAERNMAQLVGEPAHMQAAREWWARQTWRNEGEVALEPPRRSGPRVETVSHPIGIRFDEEMSGFHWSDPAPVNDAEYRAAEVNGRVHGSLLRLQLRASIQDVASFLHSRDHAVDLEGSAWLVWEAAGIKQETAFPVEGTLLLPGSGAGRREMRYELHLGRSGIVLQGYKRIRNDPGADAWRDTSSLFTTLTSPSGARSYGVVHVSLDGFLFGQLPSFEVVGTNDPARIAWALSSFGAYFFGHLQRIYLPQLERVVEGLLALDLR